VNVVEFEFPHIYIYITCLVRIIVVLIVQSVCERGMVPRGGVRVLSTTAVTVAKQQMPNPAAEHLRRLMASGEILRTPCCHDALSARLIQRSGFKAAFMSGFGVACGRGLPDAGLVSFEESKQVATAILDAGKLK
jgi:2-methylisocitrate lyase-like PEP mutase family enzyme